MGQRHGSIQQNPSREKKKKKKNPGCSQLNQKAVKTEVAKRNLFESTYAVVPPTPRILNCSKKWYAFIV